MKPLHAVISLLGLTLCFCTAVVDETAKMEEDIAAIEAVFSGLKEAVNSGNPSEWISAIADDAVFMPPDAPAVSGKDAIQEWVQTFFDQFTMEEVLAFHEVEVAGDWGFARVAFNFKATPKEGGETTEEKGKILAILKRQADGSWQVYRECWNLNAPAPEPSSDS